jgi:hypothetical protein
MLAKTFEGVHNTWHHHKTIHTMNEFLYEIANIPFGIKGLQSNIVPSPKAFLGETYSFCFFSVLWFRKFGDISKRKKKALF